MGGGVEDHVHVHIHQVGTRGHGWDVTTVGGGSRLQAEKKKQKKNEIEPPVFLLLPSTLEAVKRAVSQSGGYVVKLNLAAPRLAGGRNVLLLSGCKSGAHCHPTRISQEYLLRSSSSNSKCFGPCLSWIGRRRQEEYFRGKGFVVLGSDDGSNSSMVLVMQFPEWQ